MGIYDQNQSSQDALRKLRQGASHSRAAQEIAQRDYAKAQAAADEWEQEYQLVLKGSNQDLISGFSRGYSRDRRNCNKRCC